MANERMKVNLLEKALTTDVDYNLYETTARYDVQLTEEIIKKFTNLRVFYEECEDNIDIAVNHSIKEVLKIKSDNDINFQPVGCTAYQAEIPSENDKVVYMGRNYDFATNTSCLLVRSHPVAKNVKLFSSIAFAALSNLNITNPLNVANNDILLAAPYVCLDGINEAGVSIAVLMVDTKKGVGITCQKNQDKCNIFTTLAIRCVLDYASTTDEAIDILKKYNMCATGGADYHFFITDASGSSKVVEYSYKDKETRACVVTNKSAVTNFYVFDKGTFGHGHDRYQIVCNILAESPLTKAKLWKALYDAAQKEEIGDITSNTQWSVLFNNSNPSAEIVIHRNWSDINWINFRESV